jgi:hypothetical protein
MLVKEQHHEHAKSAPQSSFAHALVSDALLRLLRVGMRERGTRLLSRRGYLQHHRAVKQK